MTVNLYLPHLHKCHDVILNFIDTSVMQSHPSTVANYSTFSIYIDFQCFPADINKLRAVIVFILNKLYPMRSQ